MKSILLFVFITVLTLGLALAIYLGAFKKVEIAQAEAGPYRLVFKKHFGPYHKIVPVIEEVEKWAAAHSETCETSFGEYIDDPNVVAEDRLHSNGGCLVEKDWQGQLPEGFEYRELARRRYVIATFEGAPSIGPQKVYPKANEFMQQNSLAFDGPVIEMYKRLSGQGLETKYHFPVK